jgi:hypothetical protein
MKAYALASTMNSPASKLRGISGLEPREFPRIFNFIDSTTKLSWLRHYATRRKVAGSSPDAVMGFFN